MSALDVAQIRAEWAAAEDTMSRSSREYNLGLFTDRWVDALLDRVDTLEQAIRRAVSDPSNSVGHIHAVLTEALGVPAMPQLTEADGAGAERARPSEAS